MENVLCRCGSPASQFQVKKEGPNQGRSFFSCANKGACTFFQWADEDNSLNPICKCNKHSKKLKVSKDGPNKGKIFYVCDSCKFFQWEDDPKKTTSNNNASSKPFWMKTKNPNADAINNFMNASLPNSSCARCGRQKCHIDTCSHTHNVKGEEIPDDFLDYIE